MGIKIDARRTTQRSTVKETIDDENIRLRAENKVLKQERDILKKAAAPQEYFLATLTAHTSQEKFYKVCMDERERGTP